MTFRFYAHFLAAGCCFAAFSAGAYAQQAIPGSASPARVEDQVRRPDFAQSTAPQINIPEVRVEGAPEGADHINFTLKSLDIQGVNAYSPDQLRPIYAGDLGQVISLSRLYQIAAEITRKYRNDGYIITQVVVPAQTIESGTAHLTVVEGSLDQIRVDGDNNDLSTPQIQKISAHLKQSQPLRASDLERYLLLINDLPGVTARSIIGPSPTVPGKADLHIIISRKKADYMIGVDNYGSEYLGPTEWSAAAQINNPLGYNDRLLAQLAVVPTDHELYYFYGAYERPLGPNGATLLVDISHADTEPGRELELFGVEGYATKLGISAKYPLIRTRNQNLSVFARLDAETSSNKSDLGVSTDDDMRSFRVGTHYEMLSTMFGTSINTIDARISKGLNIFGASEEGDADLSRAQGNPQYTKFDAEITRLQRVADGWSVLFGIKGQTSTSPLLSPEEFGLGGMGNGYGRGYDPSEIVGDKGIAGKVELQWTPKVFAEKIESFQVFTFYDVGSIWNTDATTAADKRDSIASAGFGVRTQLTQTLSADATVAFPLTKDVNTQGNTDPHLYLSVSARF